MRPRARQRHVEMVAPARGSKAGFIGGAGVAVFRHPVAKARGRAPETPLRRARAVLLVLPDAVDQKTHAGRPCWPDRSLSHHRRGGFHLSRDRRQAAGRQWTLRPPNAKRARAQMTDLSLTIRPETADDPVPIQRLPQPPFGPRPYPT